MTSKQDHGGRMNAAIDQYGGGAADWIDLSTGINPNPYPIPEIPHKFWYTLPDTHPTEKLLNAARKLWNVPSDATIVPASGVSAIIAMLPQLVNGAKFEIQNPTYNEFAASFTEQGWKNTPNAPVQIRVHPNNPDGLVSDRTDIENQHSHLTIIDESFCDVCPHESLIDLASKPNYIILKGTGKFWGLAGMRLGFAITSPTLAEKLQSYLGPWNISGPAQFIGAQALSDIKWITQTREELHSITRKLDVVLTQNNLSVIGGTDLFRLVECDDAKALQSHLCRHQILTRVFPYSKNWIRFGLPANADDLSRVQAALEAYT